MAKFTWSAGTTGDWSNTTNWTLGASYAGALTVNTQFIALPGIQTENLPTSNRSHGAQQAIVSNNGLAAAHQDANPLDVVQLSAAGTVTAVTYNIRNALSWVSGALYTDGQTVAAGSNAYRCIVPGVSTGAPTGTGTNINNGGTAVFNWSSAIDYTSLDAFAAAHAVLTQPTIVQLWNDQPGTPYPAQSCNVTSSASAPLTITAAPGESFREGVNRPLGAPNAAYGVDIVNTTNAYAAALTVNTQFITITGIQAENLLTAEQSNGVLLTGVQQAIVSNNDLAAGHHNATALLVDKLSTAGTITVYNNLLLGLGGGGGGPIGGSIGVSIVNADANDTIAEDTIVRPSNYTFGDHAIGGEYASGFTVRNDAIFGFAVAVADNNGPPDGHNASDLSLPLFNGSSGGTYQSILNVPFTNATFVQPSNAVGSLDLRPAPGSVLVGNGSTAVPSSVDIFGNTRVSPYSIGAADPVPCFVRGTLIATARGQVPVEELQIGERILTASGAAKPIKWIGWRRIDLTAHPRPEVVAPVRIQRDAFADGLPLRDLMLSPDHAVFVDGKLICAHQLINRATIRQETDWTSVDYYHVELDRHAILLAEGLPAESYLDTGNRGFFGNSDEPLELHPDLTGETDHPTRNAGSCAPFVSDEPSVRPVWQRLADRAATIGLPAPQRATTTDPDLRLCAKHHERGNGKPVYTDSKVVIFVLPLGAEEVRLRSRAQSPTEARPWLDDRRRLGIRVQRIVLRGADELREIPMDHPGLTKGWWDIERDGQMMSRWTDGDAVVPLPAMDGPVMLELHLAGQMVYAVEAEPESQSAPRHSTLAA